MKYDLEERLIDFAVINSKIVDALPNTRIGNYIAGQMVRSGTSPALNYGEAQGAESRSDFIHKMKIILKELRETNNSLKIITRLNLISMSELVKTTDECNQLISIFVKSIETAKKNNTKSKPALHRFSIQYSIFKEMNRRIMNIEQKNIEHWEARHFIGSAFNIRYSLFK